MALPTNADIVVAWGYWFDEATGLGVKVFGDQPGTITFDPVSLSDVSTAVTPNVRDLSAHAWIKTRQRVAVVDPDTGYFAVQLVASNDPDLDAYGGRRITFSGEPSFLVEIPHNAPTTVVDAAMSAQTGLAQGSSVRALPLTELAVIVSPTPAPANAYLTSSQTLAVIADAIDAEDVAVALTDAPTITTDASSGRLFTVTLGGNRTLANPTGLVADQRLLWRITQDATGGRTLALGPMFNVNSAVTGPITLSTGPNQVDYLAGIYRQTAGKIDLLAFGPGY